MFKKGQHTDRTGKRGKLLGAHGDLISAWDKVSGPETAKKLMKAALEEALGREVTTTDKEGNVKRTIVRDFEPLRSILPYIARHMPQTVEWIDKMSGKSNEQIKSVAKNVLDNLE
jgi:hypothetical protein